METSSNKNINAIPSALFSAKIRIDKSQYGSKVLRNISVHTLTPSHLTSPHPPQKSTMGLESLMINRADSTASLKLPMIPRNISVKPSDEDIE